MLAMALKTKKHYNRYQASKVSALSSASIEDLDININLTDPYIKNDMVIYLDVGEEDDRCIDKDEATGIFMGEGKNIAMLPSEDNYKKKCSIFSIFSFEFSRGSTGAIIYTLLKSGEQRAALTHYPPTSKDLHILKIRSLSEKLKCETDENPITKIVAAILHPVTRKKNNETGYFSIKAPKDPGLVEKLSSTIQNSFKNQNVIVLQELYSEIELLGTYHPYASCDNLAVPKELEVVLYPNPEESYFQTKASWHKAQKFSELSKEDLESLD